MTQTRDRRAEARREGMRCAGDGTSPYAAERAASIAYKDIEDRLAFLGGYHRELQRLDRKFRVAR